MTDWTRSQLEEANDQDHQDDDQKDCGQTNDHAGGPVRPRQAFHLPALLTQKASIRMTIMAMMATHPRAVGLMVISAVSLNQKRSRKTDIATALRGPMD